MLQLCTLKLHDVIVRLQEDTRKGYMFRKVLSTDDKGKIWPSRKLGNTRWFPLLASVVMPSAEDDKKYFRIEKLKDIIRIAFHKHNMDG